MSSSTKPDQLITSSLTLSKSNFFGNFSKLLETGEFYDVIVEHVPTKQLFKCHRLLLSHKSKFFETLFHSNFRDSKSDKVEIHFKDPCLIFPKVLEFLYSGKTLVATNQIVAIHVASDQIMCEELGSAVLDLLDSGLTKENVFPILQQAIEMEDDIILNKAAEYIAKHFLELQNAFREIMFQLPTELFFGILSHENITLYHSESKLRNEVVSQIIQDYISVNDISKDLETFKMIVDSLVESSCLTAPFATKFLILCEQYNLKEQAAGCARIIASNFHTMDNYDFIMALKPHSFSQMIQSDDLFIKSEDQVYDIAVQYIKQNRQTISEEEKHQILQCVRYTFLSMNKLKQLKESKNEDFISRKELIEALFARILRMEDKPQVIENQPTNVKARTTRVFNYVHDFDTNGIVYWLGTMFHSESFKCPIDRKLMDVKTSAAFESGTKQAVISRDPTSCNLQSQPQANITIEFKTIQVLPNYYTLRHTTARDAERLQNWIFEGSKDGVTFQTLSTHVADTKLNTKGASGSWPIDYEKVNDYFRFFRITQTGANSSGSNYLSVAGFEIYGLMRKIEPTKLDVPA